MKLIYLFILTLTLAGSQSDSPKDEYIGTWMWIKSEYSNRGGGSTATPTTSTFTAMVEITSDFKLKSFENGVLICEADFVLPEVDSEEFSSFSEDNCYLGSAQIKNDTLQFYRYLGCPSVTSYYVKIEQ